MFDTITSPFSLYVHVHVSVAPDALLTASIKSGEARPVLSRGQW